MPHESKQVAPAKSLDLAELAQTIVNKKSTCALYTFQEAVNECLKPKQVLRRGELIAALNKLKHLVNSKILESLLKKAIELDDYELWLAVTDNVDILDESQAVESLKYILKNTNISDYEADNSKIRPKLNCVFKKTYDYRLFATELRKLSSNEFIICLLYLQDYLKSSLQIDSSFQCTDNTTATDAAPAPNDRPTLLQVAELFCCFVDAHFTHITLSSKAQEIIVDVLQLIEIQLESFTDLISIESLIKELKHNKTFGMTKANADIGYYYIETLKLI